MKSTVFLLPIRKLVEAISVRVHFREKRGVIVIIKKAEYIYSDGLKAETYNERYDVFICKHLLIWEAVRLETCRRISENNFTGKKTKKAVISFLSSTSISTCSDAPSSALLKLQ